MSTAPTSDQATRASALDIWTGIVDRETNGLDPQWMREVEEFALSLAAMDDTEFFHVCKDYIYRSAADMRFTFNTPGHAQATLCYNEALRRDPADPDRTIVTDGHEHPYRGGSIYSRAHRALGRELGFSS